MLDSVWILFAGGFGATLLGLVGIKLTQRENTPIVDILSPEEQKSYWNQRLVTEGITQCTICKHEYRPAPFGSIRVCERCMPPRVIVAPPTRRLEFSTTGRKAYTPFYMSEHFNDLFTGVDDE
jgi:hypothetical protein